MAIDPVSLAITAAVTAINMAVTASKTIEGPRLKDTSATVADYGTPLNYFVGQRVLPCPSFFAKPIREAKKKRKGKGGKQVTYSGFGTWAAHVADHPIAGIGKVWFDNHLVYDATGSEEKVYPLGDDYELEGSVRFYLGGEDQEPDPDMLAYIEARDGPGTCPAYRPTSYIYFENVPLEMIGNRFPAVSVLVRTGLRMVAQFDGWYARARIELVNPSTVLDGFSITPSGGASTIFYNGGNTDSYYPGGHPEVIYDGDQFGVTIYWITADVMDCSEVELLMQFPFGSVDDDMEASFSFQFWNELGASTLLPKDNSTIVNPGAPSFSSGDPFDVAALFPHWWYFNASSDGIPEVETIDNGNDTVSTLEELLNFVSERAGVDPDDHDWSATSDLTFSGYNWTQGTGRQIVEPLLDLYDVDVRPHDFILQAVLRGGDAVGEISTGEMVRERDSGAPYALKDNASGDLPRRIFLSYADVTTDQNPNVATPPGPDIVTAGTVRELSIDMQTLALFPDDAQQLTERRLRRMRYGRASGEFSVTRRSLAMEPGDVWVPTFDDREWTMRLIKLEIGANGVLGGEWERDAATLAVLSGSAGGVASGFIPDVVPDAIETTGNVMDIPLIVDAHEQSAPLAYLVAGPAEPGTWTGADFAQSETGELDSYVPAWDGIGSSNGSTMGTVAEAMPEAVPWVPDLATLITVTINVGELTAATLDDLNLDPTLNLAAIRSGEGWELVQFMTPTLVAELTYEVTGFLRGVRGTEWAMAGHDAGDAFVLLDDAKIHTMGAAELGDTDWYVVGPTGQSPNQDNAFSVLYTGASHKPYAPVYGEVEFSGNDVLFTATRRTRLGGATVDGQDVPLGETAESWSLDIIDNTTSPVAVKRTINSASLPINYTEAMQIADWGAALNAVSPIVIPEANLYQVAPPLSLRGYPLNFPEETP